MASKKKIRVVHPGAESWGQRLKWLIIGGLIAVPLTVLITPFMKSCIDWGNKKYILNELQYGRNQMHLSLASAELNHHRKINVEFPHRSKVSEVSGYNSESGLNISHMYQALDNGIKEANRLHDEMRKDPQDKELIANLKSSILRSLDTLDQFGPSVAVFLGGTWEIPPKDMSPQDMVNYLERVIVTSSATGTVTSSDNILKK
jgi:hypothetical protein